MPALIVNEDTERSENDAGLARFEKRFAVGQSLSASGVRPAETLLLDTDGYSLHSLFDAEWYRSQHLSSLAAQSNPLRHYLLQGRDCRVAPNPYFDTRWYVANWMTNEPADASPLVHYLLYARQGQFFSPNPLFDPNWYMEKNEDCRAAGVDPFVHYVRWGAHEARDPHPLFLAEWYQNRHPESAEAQANPLLHYSAHGREEGVAPNPYFDTAWFVKTTMADAPAGTNPLAHYVLHARNKHYLAPNPLFDPQWYLNRYEDCRAEGVDPFVHFVRWGSWEGRDPHPLFNTDWYCNTYPDVARNGFRPFEHYLRHGEEEGRSSHPLFDAPFYQSQHKNLEAAQRRPLVHYLQHGRERGFDPNPFFSSSWYADLYLAEKTSANPLVHFVNEGQKQQCKPHPLFDEVRYLAKNPDVAYEVRGGHIISGYDHFIRYGSKEIDRGNHRILSFDLNGLTFELDSQAYVQDNPDVAVFIARGEYEGGVCHLFQQGYWEAEEGLRAIYSKNRFVSLLKRFDGGFRNKQLQSAKRGRNKSPDRSSRLAIYAHYDRDGLVDEHVVIAVKALAENCSSLIFVSATNDEAELDKVRPFVSEFFIKNEAGRDFGSWYIAIKTLGLEELKKYDRIIFVNDSIYFPVRPIAPVFQYMDDMHVNLFGLSDSKEGGYHCQSFFLAFDRVAQEKILSRFISMYEENPFLTKMGQIRLYEYGLSAIALKEGLSVGAYFPIDDVREDVIRKPSLRAWEPLVRFGLGGVNPTHHLWDLMVGHYAWPALKVELLRDNPANRDNLDAFPDLIAGSELPVSVIKAHLKRMKSPPETRKPHARFVPVMYSESAPRIELKERIYGGGNQGGRRLILFAHYDPDGLIDPHIVRQVEAYAAADCSMVFVTASDKTSEIDKIRDKTASILIKNGAGRDFGSWALAIEQHKQDFARFDEVIWINDSTYFPLYNPAEMFAEMDRRNLDFWGVVDSHGVRWHVMSWFWAFGRKVIEDGWFDWYLQEYNPAHEKWMQIHNYEMRLPQLLRDRGYSVDTYIRSHDVSERFLAKHPNDPRTEIARCGDFTMTHFFWDFIITEFKCPAIKVELLRDNPLALDISSVLNVVREHTDYDPDLIRAHLRRVKTGHLGGRAVADFKSGMGSVRPQAKTLRSSSATALR